MSAPAESSAAGSQAWFGAIPNHWELAKGKALFVQVRRPDDPNIGIVTAFRDGAVTLRSNRRTAGFTEAVQFAGYQGVRPGDLVIHQMDGFAGAIGVSDSAGRCSPVCAVAVPRGASNPYYYARVLRSMAASGWISALSRGIRERSTDFRFSVFREQLLPVPSLEEQRLIVRFLDQAELRIARVIAAKSTVLEMLGEARAAVVAGAVLGAGGERALHGDLGYLVPESWDVEPFWSVAPQISISGVVGRELLSVFLDRGVIRYSESSGQVHKPSLDLSKYQLVLPGDLVLNNQQAWRGSVGVSSYEGIVSPAYIVCRLTKRLDAQYANFLFRSPALINQFVLASRGVGSIQRQVHRQSLRDVRVPIPPMEEQIRISNMLRDRTAGIDSATEAVRKEIALLKEYRVKLISDVVTGKLDVTKEAEGLPDIDPVELAQELASLTGGIGDDVEDEEGGGDEDD